MRDLPALSAAREAGAEAVKGIKAGAEAREKEEEQQEEKR